MQLKSSSLINHLTVICLLMTSALTYGQKKLKFEIPSLKGCAIIGYSNASINECGYCVGDNTGLEKDFGKDCEGNCFGDSVIDCMGVCGGNAYIDECTGMCTTADEPDVKEVNGSVSRDCRGLCIPPELSRPQQQAYETDECGVCRLQSTERSAFIDCKGNCQSVGLERVSLVCGQCVEKTVQVMDECGNCRNEKHICSCDRDATICGCNDPNNCYNVNAVIPRAIPENIESKILLLGYFHPVIRDLNCLLEYEATGDVLSFPVIFVHKNKTALECNVTMKKGGNYKISLGIIKNSINSFRKGVIRLIVYNPKDVSNVMSGSEIQPKNISTLDSNQTIVLQFSVSSKSLFGIPFRCKVIYSSDNSYQLTDETNQLNTCSLNPSKLRSKSQTLSIIPTFDGINLLSQPFQLKITAPFPQISHQNCYVSEDGLAVIVMFEKAVHIIHHLSDNSLTVCEHLLTNGTLDYLSFYGLKSCLWTTKTQFIINTEKPISENSVNIKFKKNVIKESNQMIALSNDVELEVTAGKLSAEPNWWSYEPIIAITGPSEVPDCGIFALIGHFSSPRGTTDVQFLWEIEGDVGDELKEHVETHGKSSNLLLDTNFFEHQTPYKFIFKAYIPVREQTLEVGHTLIRHEYNSPVVSIYHTRLLQSTPLYSDQDILLLADVSVLECVFPVQKIILFWKVIDPKILFPFNDLNKRHSLLYEIKANTVPTETAVDIYLNAFLGYEYNETSGARFTFVSSKAPLKASIADGSTKITIGSKSGSFRLWSKSSKTNKSLVYQWSCHESKTAQPCYHNFGASNQIDRKDSLLIDRDLQKQPVLELNSSYFQPNKQYWFGLQVFDKNDRKVFSETEYTLVKVIEGFAPQVFVGPLYIKGEHLVPYNARLSTHLVPARTPITVKGIIRPAKLVNHIKWQSINGLFDLNWSFERIGDELHSELYLHKNHLHAFGTYSFKLIACNDDGLCSDADTSLMAVQSVTMCELSVEHFTEYKLSIAVIERCNTPPNSAPLTYQLFIEEDSLPNPMPISVPQFSSVIKFIGTPVLSSNHISRFGAQVCDRFGNCELYYSNSVTVEQTDNETEAINDLLRIAKRYRTAGDSIAALTVLGTVLLRQDLTFNPLIDKVINNSIKYSTHALQIPDMGLTDGHLSVVYSTLSNGFFKSNNTFTKRQLLSLIQKYTEKAIALKTLPKIETIKTLYFNLMNTFVKTSQQKRLKREIDSELLSDIRNTYKMIRSVAASQIPVGSSLRLTSHRLKGGHRVDNAVTEIIHSYRVFDITIRAQMDVNSTVEAKINFGEEVKQNYSSFWNCGQRKHCQSVIFCATIYPSDNPYPQREESHKLTPILELAVLAPNTGAEQPVRGHYKAASFQSTITGNASDGGTDKITRCHYFDEFRKIWKIDDVQPLGIVYEKVGCWSGHLSTFVVLRTVAGISFDYVIGVMVACLMGVLVFGIMVVFFVQKKREDANRVSPKPSESTLTKSLENPRYRQTKSKLSSIEIQTASQSVLITD